MHARDLSRFCTAWEPPTPFDPSKSAAVAAIVLPSGELLFMRRAEVPSDPWSGHISFPGGRTQAPESDPLATAIRETSEEIGVSLSIENLLGTLEPVHPVSGVLSMSVYPFLFFLDEEPEFSTNREVASLHRFSLERLLAGEGRGRFVYSWQDRQITLPCVEFDGVRLWGLTLRIVDDLLHRIDGAGTGLERQTNR